MVFFKDLLTRALAFGLRLYAFFFSDPLLNAAPYGACDTGADALGWIDTGTAPRTCLEHQNRTRCWFTYTPDAIADAAAGVPLLVHLHGAGGCAGLPAMNWGSVADEEGFVVVWPAGVPTALPFLPDFLPEMTLSTWNDGAQLFGAEEAGIDDLGFLELMFDELLARTNADGNLVVDPARVYLSGHSNGATMTQRFALQTTGVLAAAVAVSGAGLPNDPAWSPGGNVSDVYGATPLLLVSGRDDNVVPFGERRGPLAGALPSLDGWAVTNGCPAASATVSEGEGYVRHSYTGCDDGSEVVLLEIPDAGHHPFTKGEGEFQISPWDIIAECPFRGIPFFYEPDCQLIELDTTRMAWEFLSAFERS